MKELKKFGLFLVLCAAVVGAGSSIGWLCFHKEWFAAIGALIVITFAYPKWVELLKRMMNED